MIEESQPLRFAGFWKRFNAYGIDSFLVLVVTFFVSYGIGDVFAQSPEQIQALVDAGMLPAGSDPQTLVKQMLGGDGGSWLSFNDIILPILVSAAYNIFFVAGNWQATPGKHWCKIKVVMVDGGRLTLLESAIRHVVSGVSIWPLGLGYLPIFFTKEKLALHDMICNTRVIMR